MMSLNTLPRFVLTLLCSCLILGACRESEDSTFRSAWKKGKLRSKQDQKGFIHKADAEKFLLYIKQEDTKAAKKFMIQLGVNKKLAYLKKGDIVHALDTSIFDGLFKARKDGETQEFWVILHEQQFEPVVDEKTTDKKK